jgi:type II secretory pathway predicted ATPase ExeA
MMDAQLHSFPLTPAQHAAEARIAYALEAPGGAAILCGPAGVGKTLLLERMAETVALQGQCLLADSCAIARDWAAGSDPAEWPGLLLIDNAHLAADNDLAELLENVSQAQVSLSLVLAGQGRLLTLAARHPQLARIVRVRAVMPPLSLEESQTLLMHRLGGLLLQPAAAAVVRTLHEIAAGIPAEVVRLADLAGLLLAADPTRPLAADDIELIHRRASLQAA